MTAVTTAAVKSDTTRPAFITSRKAEDDDGKEITYYGVKLSKMANGDKLTLRLTSNPNEWKEYNGEYGPSYLGFFETVDGTPITCFVSPNNKTAGKGKTLLQRFREFNDGDVLTLGLEVKTVKAKGKGPVKTWKCFTLDAADPANFPEGGNVAVKTAATTAPTASAPTPVTPKTASASVLAATFMPKVVLSDEQYKLLKFMAELDGIDRETVTENIKGESRVGNKVVTFTPLQQKAILDNPKSYGLNI